MKKILINSLEKVGTVHENVFGNFIENIGTCIYGGIYDPESPLSDENGFRKDVMEATKSMGVSNVRFPGGCFAPVYHFKDGIGSPELRPRSNKTPEEYPANGFGTDEFIAWCRKVKAEPYICVNMGSGTAEEARDWVDYCNTVNGTEWSEKRIQNGNIDPYKVKYWAIGNEISASYEYGYTETPEEYIEKAEKYIALMKECDPTIKITLAGCIFPLGAHKMTKHYYDWNFKVMSVLYENVDYISMHHYIGTVGKSKYLGANYPKMDNLEFHLAMHEYMQEVSDAIDIIRGDISLVNSNNKTVKNIQIAVDEYNPWYNTLPNPKLMHMYNISDALLVGRYFNIFIKNADIVELCNMAQLVNVLPSMVTESGGTGFFRQGISYIQEMYLANKDNMAIDAYIESDTYEGKYYKDVPYVDISASLNSKKKIVVLNLVNAHPSLTSAYEITVFNEEIKSMEGWMISDSDLKAMNTFENPDRIKPVRIVIDKGNQIMLSSMTCMVVTIHLL